MQDRHGVIAVDLDQPRVELHHLPCTIHHTGRARVKDYFIIKQDEQDSSTLESSIRGRLLKGSKIHLPDAMQGLVILQSAGEGVADSTWEVSGVFDSFTYWNHDTTPSSKDQPRQWIEEWPVLAAAIHAPVDLERRKGFNLSAAPQRKGEEREKEGEEEIAGEDANAVAKEADASQAKGEEAGEDTEKEPVRKRKRRRSEAEGGGVGAASDTPQADDMEDATKKDGEKNKKRRVEENDDEEEEEGD